MNGYACYSMLLLAGMNAYGTEAAGSIRPLPKWQWGCARHRMTTQERIQILRQEVWGCAIDQIAAAEDPNDFVTDESIDTKSPVLLLTPAPPLEYARTG